MSAPIEVDIQVDRIIVTFHSGSSDAEYREYLDEMTRIMRFEFRNRRRIVINDASRWMKSNAVQRKMQAEWIKEHAVLLQNTTAAIVFVIPSAMIRGAMRAVLWLQPLPVPHELFSSLDEAVAWTNAHVSEYDESYRRSATPSSR